MIWVALPWTASAPSTQTRLCRMLSPNFRFLYLNLFVIWSGIYCCYSGKNVCFLMIILIFFPAWWEATRVFTVILLQILNTVQPRLSNVLIIWTFSLVPIWAWILILLVTIKIRSHILFKTTALKSPVKCKGFLLSKRKSSAHVCRNWWKTFEWVLSGSELHCCKVKFHALWLAWQLYGKEIS